MRLTHNIVAAILALSSWGMAGAVEDSAALSRASIASVQLVSGERLAGTVLNTNFTWRTPYARVTLDCSAISEMGLLQEPGANQRLVSVARDRLSGLLEDDYLLLSGTNRNEMRLRRETIATVKFEPALARTNDTSGMVLRFRNGDIVYARLGADFLPFRRSEGDSEPLSVPVSNLFSVIFAPARSASMTLRDGRELHGQIATDSLLLVLEAGPSIAVHPASLVSAQSREAVELRMAAARKEGFVGPHGLHMVWVPKGEFLMGSPQSESGRDVDEGPLTKVRIEEGFWIGKYEVTQDQFQQVMGLNPSSAGGTNLPVEKVTWIEAMEFCRRLTRESESEGNLIEGFSYRLPTEAEWEYACRAGSQSRFSYGDDPVGDALERYAWFTRNSDSATHAVGTREPNAWGLYDTHGNVWEWCLDRWEALPGGTITNRSAVPEGSLRAARGGSWLYDVKACRCANRDDYSMWNRCADVGFRIVLAPAK